MSVCVTCGAKRVVCKRVSESRSDGLRVIVPAFVCTACGERVFDLKVLASLEGRRTDGKSK